MADSLRILLLANSDASTPQILNDFKSAQYAPTVLRVETLNQYKTALADNSFDIAVLDVAAPPMSAFWRFSTKATNSFPF